MNNEENSTELLKTAVQEALATPEPVKIERKPYLHETVGRIPLTGNKFPIGRKAKIPNQPKMVDGKVVDLHKPRTVLNSYTKKPEIIGVPIMVQGTDLMDKTFHNGVLMTKAERDKLSWEEIEASNKVIK